MGDSPGRRGGRRSDGRMTDGMGSAPDVSLVLPVYYNAENLPRTVGNLKETVVDAHPDKRFELVFVDDGSGDDSLGILLALQRRHPDLIRIIKLTRNFGQVSAVWCGYSHARGDF